MFRLHHGSLLFWVPTLLEFVELVLPGKAHLASGVGNNTISVPNVKGLRAADVALHISNELNYNYISIMEICWRCGQLAVIN